MNHQYREISDLNAPYDQVPLQGLAGAALGAGSLGYSGSMGSLSGALGATGSGPMVWLDKSNPNGRVMALQAEVNAVLMSKGYNSVGQDGVLGPATCGGISFIGKNYGSSVTALMAEALPVCRSSTAPTKTGSGGGGGGGLPAKTTPIDTANMYGDGGGMSDTMWIVLGTVAAAGAVGAALYFKKKR